ncbi:chemotaxis protein, partial [Thioclava sp. BHET1]
MIAEIAHREAGITLPEVKEPLVYSRLIKRLRALSLRNFAEYCTLIASAEGTEERVQMISALTTNVTHFFREGHHFRHLEEEVLPALIDRAQRGGRVRLWSAGCATGEEAYSIAFSLLRLCPEAARYDIRILATDIDPQVLETAEIGLY